jgi:hypothetical protein
MLQKVRQRITNSVMLVIFSLFLCLGLAVTHPYQAKADDLPVVHKSGTLEDDETWTAGNVYVVDSTVTIPEDITLTINPGVIIKAAIPWYQAIDVAGGTLSAVGTSSAHITFTSIRDDTLGGDSGGDGVSAPDNGDYVAAITGLSESSSSIATQYTEFRYGTRSIDVSCAADDSSYLSAMHNTFESTAKITNCQPADYQFASNTFDVPSNLYALELYSLDPSNVDMYGSDKNVFMGSGRQKTIFAENNQIESGNNWTYSGATGATLYVTGASGLTVNGTLSLGEGALVKYSPYYGGIVVSLSATLYATGTSTTPVIFTSINDDSIGGDSDGNGISSQLDGGYNTALQVNGGTVETTYSLFKEGAKAVRVSCSVPLLTHVTLNDDTFNSGVEFQSCDQSVAVIQRNQFQVPPEYPDFPLVLGSTGMTGIAMSGTNQNVFSGSTIGKQRTVRWYSSSVADSSTVTVAGSTGATLVANSIDVDGTLNLNDGLLIKVYPGSYTAFNAESGGEININGTSGSHVIATSGYDDAIGGESLGDGATSGSAGDSTAFISSQSGSTVTAAYVDIKYASSAFAMEGGTNTTSHTNISNVNHGIYATNSGTFKATSTTIEDSGNGIYAAGSSEVAYRGMLDDITGDYIEACDWNTDCKVDATYTDWGSSNGPFESNGDPLFCGQVWVSPWKVGSSNEGQGTWQPNCYHGVSPALMLIQATTDYDNFSQELGISCNDGSNDACDSLDGLQTCWASAFNAALSALPVPVPSLPSYNNYSTLSDFAPDFISSAADAADAYASSTGSGQAEFFGRMLGIIQLFFSLSQGADNCIAQF